MRAFLLLLSAVGLMGLVPEVAAQAPAGGRIRVVTRDLEPFSFEHGGRRVGFAAELWDRLARETKLDYEVKIVGTAQEIIDALMNHTADVGLGAISVTARREAVIDFSQPFYESGLRVLVAGTSGSFADNLLPLVKNLFNLELIGAFALLQLTEQGIGNELREKYFGQDK